MCCWKSWTAIAVETIPASATPARKNAGRRKRRERNIALGGVRVLRRRDLVPDSPDGHDRRGVAELPAQLTDVDVDGARVSRERVAPDALEQLVAGEHEPPMVDQLPEQVELLRRELDLLLADADLPAARVDREHPVPELLR